MEQTNIRMKSLFKKRLQYEAIEKGKTLQDTIIDYLILGMSLERIIQTNNDFELPVEFEFIKSTIELDIFTLD